MMQFKVEYSRQYTKRVSVSPTMKILWDEHERLMTAAVAEPDLGRKTELQNDAMSHFKALKCLVAAQMVTELKLDSRIEDINLVETNHVAEATRG